MWAFYIAMQRLNNEQLLLVKKILREYINKNVSHKSPLLREIEEIIKAIENYWELQLKM